MRKLISGNHLRSGNPALQMKFHVKGTVRVVRESYEHGEIETIDRYTIDEVCEFIKIIKVFQHYGFSERIDEYVIDTSDSTFYTAVQLTKTGEEPTRREEQLWKDGAIDLYTHEFGGTIRIVDPQPVTREIAKNLGCDVL